MGQDLLRATAPGGGPTTAREDLREVDRPRPPRSPPPSSRGKPAPAAATSATEITTRDVAVAEEFLRRTYGGAQLELDPARFELTATAGGDERLTHSHQRWRGGGRISIGPQRHLLLAELVGGRLAATSGRETIDTSRPFLVLPDLGLEAKWEDRLEVHVLRLDLGPVHAAARSHHTAPHRPFRFTGTAPVDDRAAALWSSTASYVRQHVLSQPDALEHELLRQRAFDMLVAVALRTFPNSTLSLPDSSETSAPAPATLRRALAYMEEHAARPITLPDVAAAAGLSPRGLVAQFRRTLDTTPMRHLRRLRLEGARHDLRHADPREQTVADIARRWGFVHLGRFAGSYREVFGETPVTTLRR